MVLTMAKRKNDIIKLTEDEFEKLTAMICMEETSKTIRNRCQIMIDLDIAHGRALTREQSAEANGVCVATVNNTVAKYIDGGLDAVIELKRSINSDNARLKVDEQMKEQIIKLASSPAPEGRSRWSIRSLEKESKNIFAIPVSRETIRRTLQKANIDLAKITM